MLAYGLSLPNHHNDYETLCLLLFLKNEKFEAN